MIWQRTRNRRLEELIRSAKTDFPVTEEYQERITAALEDAPAPVMIRSRKRVIAVAALAAVALFALGFVPIPMGRAPGALERAMAATQDIVGIYVRAHGIDQGVDFNTEEWWSQDGFHRYERRQEDRLHLTLTDKDREVRYYYYHAGSWVSASQRDRGARAIDPLFFPMDRIREQFAWIQNTTGWHIQERRERSLLRGTLDVIEAEGTLPGGEWAAVEVMFFGGDRIKIRAEADDATGRLVSFQQFVYIDGDWNLCYSTDVIDWDTEIPAEIRTFNFPIGTKVTETHWWADRTRQVLAESETNDWLIKLHSVEANSQGDLYLTFSRWLKPNSELARISTYPHGVVAWAVDQYGTRFVQSKELSDIRWDGRGDGSYWTVILKPQSRVIPLNLPCLVTITLFPYDRDESQGQYVTFKDVQRPLLQAGADLFADSVKVVQY